MTAEELTKAFYHEFTKLRDQGLIVTGISGTMEYSEGQYMKIGIAQVAEDYEEVSPETHRIGVLHPFIFDGRKLPDSFMGFRIFKVWIAKSIPRSIERRVIDSDGSITSWTPEQFRQYARKNAKRIRQALNDPTMTEEDILNAIAQNNFKRYCTEYEQDRLKRLQEE
jgi:hypothetical protein